MNRFRASPEGVDVIDSNQTNAPPSANVAPQLRWWKEVVLVLGLYWLYSGARNQFGSSSVAPSEALENAERIIDIEQAMGLFFEQEVQSWFIEQEWFLWLSNVFYGAFHFGVTIFVLVWMFLRHPSRYRRWRATIAYTTVFGLIGFSLFPLMPPRLLPGCPPENPFGGCATDYSFVDTLAEYGGLWSFDSGRMAEISNQYAAMPSLHIAWAAWCFVAMAPVVRHDHTKVLLALYPFATLFVIVVTANHFWIDAIGGIMALGAGIVAGHFSIRMVDEWRAGRSYAAAKSEPVR